MSRFLNALDSASKGKTLYAVSACATIVTCLLNAVLPRFVALPQSVKIFLYGLAALSIFPFLYFTVYAIRVRNENEELQKSLALFKTENRNLKQCAAILHGINHAYRDVLSSVFGPQGQALTPREATERDTLAMVCQRISDMFTLLTGEKCMATVKLIYVEDEAGGRQRSYCGTLARSELNCERDRILMKYEIGTGKNTAFDTARRAEVHGIAHFFSPDLEKDADEEKYYNERVDWKRFYRSAIVVPIRYMQYDALGTNNEVVELGFLAVDTMATNKLNGDYHVQHLAALADQMFNFMSLMREKYHLREARVQAVMT
jgi:hypothetical protein